MGTYFHTGSLLLLLRSSMQRPVRIAPEVVLSNEERAELTKLARSKLTSVRLAQRARIVLLAAQVVQNIDIAEQLGSAESKSRVGASAMRNSGLGVSSVTCRAARRP